MTLADVIVIGGGIAGISAAAELAAHAKVVVLEGEKQLGYHSTGRSAAVFIRNYGNATLRAINAAAEPVFMTPTGISETSLLSPRGVMFVADKDELPKLDAFAQGSSGLERLTAAEAVEFVPILRGDRIAAAMLEPAAQNIDVDRMLQGYVRLLKSRGGQALTGAGVTDLHRQGGVWQIRTALGDFSAPVVVNASGAWADEIAKLAGVASVGLTPLRRSAALIPAPEGYASENWPVFGSIAETWYAKPEAGKLMVSPADEDPVAPHDAWPDDMVLAEGLYRFEQAVTVSVRRVEHSWAGLRTFAPDRTPVVGFDPDAKGFFWLAGQGGYGVQTAPALARLMAALVASQQPELDAGTIAALSPERFY